MPRNRALGAKYRAYRPNSSGSRSMSEEASLGSGDASGKRKPFAQRALRNESWRFQHKTIQSFISLRLDAPPRPQACSMPPEFQISILLHHVYTHAAGIQSFRASYLPASTSTRLQRASILPYLHTSMPLRLHACSASPELPNSIPPRLHACNVPPELLNSIPPRLHACSAPPELPSSISPRPHARDTPSELPNSRAPYLF